MNFHKLRFRSIINVTSGVGKVMPHLTEKAIVRPAIYSRTAEIRRQSYAVDDEEAQVGLSCVEAVLTPVAQNRWLRFPCRA